MDKLFNFNVLTGVVLGLLIGLHYPMDAHKTILVAAAAFMVLKLVGGLKGILK